MIILFFINFEFFFVAHMLLSIMEATSRTQIFGYG